MTCGKEDPGTGRRKMATEAIRWLQHRLEADEMLDGMRQDGSKRPASPTPAAEPAKERVPSKTPRTRKGTARPRPLGNPA